MRNKAMRLTPLLPLLLLSLLAIAPMSLAAPAGMPSADQCDWTGSGGGGKGVRPVYLRCSRGSVSWRYPRGALRVVLISGAAEGENLRGCIKSSGPARVYLEGKTSLKLLYSPGDGKHESLHRCFRTRGPVAALYVEADVQDQGSESGAPPGVHLHYDLETQLLADPEEAECRPCSKEELAKAFCQSDLVARGTVSAVERRPELESAEILLRVTKTLRRVEENEENEIDSGDARFTRETRIRVPTVCDARHGQGEFVIMAKKRLGDLTLSCAPRLEEWAKAVRELESAPCVLRS
ncbi:meteorin-like protein [Trichogramma pretiosum]|uniref:meteorin-like protein n=1 Tax=Trichogramma pretiosum TaxID=7493 RepID=UPI0006C9D3A0|nr:meteorin-like protein [Trichogramma pretiosum]